MVFVPDYYFEFRCIADKCRHSCCIGWEIDIDEETYEQYKTVSGSFGKKLQENIAMTDGVPHFLLGEKERCPFLDCRNLCTIITELGEDSLCQICADHPRFCNFYEDRTEIGLGLCCEEACRLILTRQAPMKLVNLEGEEEESVFFGFREKLFRLLHDRSLSLDERISRIGVKLPEYSVKEWKKLFLELEHLDPYWVELFLGLEEIDFNFSKEWDIPFEQLLTYFLYRHLGEGIYDGRFSERVAFSLLGLHIIKLLCANHKKRTDSVAISDFLEYARMYSAEIEYSEENTATLLSILEPA